MTKTRDFILQGLAREEQRLGKLERTHAEARAERGVSVRAGRDLDNGHALGPGNDSPSACQLRRTAW